ncbi:hypothetical protein PybrP1_011503 [[Pythium] brassicae (nom. inval.)]|nr:hypothetical protein PybrP1_011503 [[Pythium] brassicae (nom. inval.)]
MCPEIQKCRENSNTGAKAGARATAINSSTRYVCSDDLTVEAVHKYIRGNATGTVLVAVMGKFALHLVFLVSDSEHLGCLLGTRQVRLVLAHSGLRAATECGLNKMGHAIQKYIPKQETNDGTYWKKAPACTKTDLDALMETLDQHAAGPVDYGDAAAVCLMWHMFGRSTDTALHKVKLGNLGRISLYRVRAYEDDQRSPSGSRCRRRPTRTFSTAFLVVQEDSESIEEVSLAEAISVAMQTRAADGDGAPDEEASDVVSRGSAGKQKSTAKAPRKSNPGVHAYINRLIQQLYKRCANAQVTRGFTSHNDNATLPALSALPLQSQELVAHLQLKLFANSTGFADAKINAELSVLGVLTATALVNLEQMKSRVSEGAASAGISDTELGEWVLAVKIVMAGERQSHRGHTPDMHSDLFCVVQSSQRSSRRSFEK